MTANTNGTTGSLSERAMLVHLGMSVWTARKRDAKVTKETNERLGIKEGAGNYWKDLLPEENSAHKLTIHHQTMARQTHNNLTLPWMNDGTRILLASNFIAYTEEMRKHEDAFWAAAHAFFPVYPDLAEKAKSALNGSWDAADYPPVADLKRRYRFKVTVLPLPSVADFRVDLGDENVERLKAEIEESVKAVAQEAMRESWQRLHRVLHKMAEKLSDPDATYRDSLFGNVADLCDLLPHLNLTADPALAAMEQTIREKVLTIHPQAAREDKQTRAALAAEVSRIEASVAACFA